MTFSPTATSTVTSWQDRALDRALESTAARSAARLERVLTAARELTEETDDASFTVAEVAARAGVSLKSFYRWFPGKDDLVLALLEEDIRTAATMLHAALARAATPEERLERYVRSLFRFARHAPGYARVLVREHRRLSLERPDDLALAIGPLLALLEGEIAGAAEAGRARPGDVRRATEVVFAVLLDGLAAMTLAGRDSKEVAATVWRFVAGGLRIDEEDS